MTQRKPRADARLLNLPEQQQAQLADWLLAGMPYHVARATVEKEFGVKTSMAGLAGFWRDVCQPALIRRRARMVETADAITAAITGGNQVDKALEGAIKQKAFEILINPAAEAADVSAIAGMALKIRDQDLKAEQVGLARQKFQRETCELFLRWSEDQRAREIAAGSTTNAEKIERLGQLMFGEDWKP